MIRWLTLTFLVLLHLVPIVGTSILPPHDPPSAKVLILPKGGFGMHQFWIRFEVDPKANVILSMFVYGLPQDPNSLIEMIISEPIYESSAPAALLSAGISPLKEGGMDEPIPFSYTQETGQLGLYQMSSTNYVLELGKAVQKTNSTILSSGYYEAIVRLRMNSAVRKIADIYVFDVQTTVAIERKPDQHAYLICNLELLLPDEAFVVYSSSDLTRLGPNRLDSYGEASSFPITDRSVWAHVEYQQIPLYYRTPYKEIIFSFLLGLTINPFLSWLGKRIKSCTPFFRCARKRYSLLRSEWYSCQVSA